MMDQLTLLEGVRLDPPNCYDEVATAIETVIENQPEVAGWSSDKLAFDVWRYGLLGTCPKLLDVEWAVRIYRERNGCGLDI